MKFKGRFRLGLLAVPRGAAAAAHQVFFNANTGGRPELVVSDGRLLAVVPVDPVEGEKPKSGRVDGKAWGRATAGIKKDEERQLTLKDGQVLVRDDQGREIMTVPAGTPKEGVPPANYRKFIPEPGSQQFALALDPRQVVKMARILGATDRLVLHGDVNPKHGVVHKSLRVSHDAWGDNDQPHGVMMPEIIEEDRRGRKLVLEAKKD